MTKDEAERARIRCIISAANWKATASECEATGEHEFQRISENIARAFVRGAEELEIIIERAGQ